MKTLTHSEAMASQEAMPHINAAAPVTNAPIVALMKVGQGPYHDSNGRPIRNSATNGGAGTKGGK